MDNNEKKTNEIINKNDTPNNESDRFKIRAIEHYEDMSKSYKKLGILYAVCSGLFAVCSLLNVAKTSIKDDPSFLMQLPTYLYIICSICYAKLSHDYFKRKKYAEEDLEKCKNKIKEYSK